MEISEDVCGDNIPIGEKDEGSSVDMVPSSGDVEFIDSQSVSQGSHLLLSIRNAQRLADERLADRRFPSIMDHLDALSQERREREGSPVVVDSDDDVHSLHSQRGRKRSSSAESPAPTKVYISSSEGAQRITLTPNVAVVSQKVMPDGVPEMEADENQGPVIVQQANGQFNLSNVFFTMSGLSPEQAAILTGESVKARIVATMSNLSFGLKGLDCLALVSEQHMDGEKRHIHGFIKCKKGIKFRLKLAQMKAMFYGPVAGADNAHPFLRAITDLKGLCKYFLKHQHEPQLWSPIFGRVYEGETIMKENLTLGEFHATLGGAASAGVMAQVWELIGNGVSDFDICAKFPSMSRSKNALAFARELWRASKMNTWEKSLEIPALPLGYGGTDPNNKIPDLEEHELIVTNFNKIRKACMEGKVIPRGCQGYLVGDTRLHKTSFFNALSLIYKWPTVKWNFSLGFPGSQLAAVIQHRPLLIVEQINPQKTSMPYEDLEAFLDMEPGTPFDVKGQFPMQCPDLKCPLVISSNYSPNYWYKGAWDEHLGRYKRTIDKRHIDAMNSRFREVVYYLKTPLNFFPDPTADALKLTVNAKKFDEEEIEEMV